MPKTIVKLTEEHDKIVIEVMEKEKISNKDDAILFIISEYK